MPTLVSFWVREPKAATINFCWWHLFSLNFHSKKSSASSPFQPANVTLPVLPYEGLHTSFFLIGKGLVAFVLRGLERCKFEERTIQLKRFLNHCHYLLITCTFYMSFKVISTFYKLFLVLTSKKLFHSDLVKVQSFQQKKKKEKSIEGNLQRH